MADFKLLGATTPVQNGLAVMTQGLGYPLRVVEDSDHLPDGGVVQETLMIAGSPITQVPTGLDTALQLSFGVAQAVESFDLDALGNFTCLVTDEYAFNLRLQFGRLSNPGVAIIFGRVLIDGAQIGASVSASLDNVNASTPSTFSFTLPLVVGQIITMEILRDSAGVDSGGVFATASSAGWNDSPSAQLVISRSRVNL
jgi:hypothetical protein